MNMPGYIFIKLKRTPPLTFFVLGLSVIVLGLGLYLRCQLYFMDRALWIDESAVWGRLFGLSSLLNALSLNFREAIGRPLGFFFFSKLFTQLFNDSEVVLRLVAFIPSVLVLFLTFYSGRLLFKAQTGILLPLSVIIAFSYEFISSTCHYKHYLMEAFVAILLITLTAIYLRNKSIIALSITLASASLALLFGNNAYLISPLVFLACLLQLKRDKKHIITFGLSCVFGAAVAGWVYFSYIHGHTAGLNTLFQRPFLNSYYHGTGGVFGYFAWAGDQFYNLVDHLLLNEHTLYIKQNFNTLSTFVTVLFTLLSLLGAVYFVVRREAIGLVVAGPMAMLYIFNILGFFPIGIGRWSAHLAINLAFMACFGLQFIYFLLEKIRLGKVVFVLSILTAVLLFPAKGALKADYWIPMRITTRYLKSMLEEIKAEYQNPKDVPPTLVHFVPNSGSSGVYYLRSHAYRDRYGFLNSKSGPYTMWKLTGLGAHPDYEAAMEQYRSLIREDNRRILFLISHGKRLFPQGLISLLEAENVEFFVKRYPHGLSIEVSDR